MNRISCVSVNSTNKWKKVNSLKIQLGLVGIYVRVYMSSKSETPYFLRRVPLLLNIIAVETNGSDFTGTTHPLGKAALSTYTSKLTID